MKHKDTNITLTTGVLHRSVEIFYRILQCRFVMLFLIIMCAAGGPAQNNPIKIDDRLYDIFTKAAKVYDKPEALHLADSMYSMAERIGDKKGKLYALKAKLTYWSYTEFNNENNRNFDRADEIFYDKCTEADELRLYFETSEQRVNTLVLNNRLQEALMFNKKIQKRAFEHNNHYGIYNALYNIATIRYKRNESYAALESYIGAVEYGEKHLPERDISEEYFVIAQLCGQIKNEELGLKYLDKALTMNPSNISGKAYKAFVLLNLGREKDFLKLWSQIKDDSSFLSSGSQHIRKLRFYAALTERRWNEAEILMNEEKDKNTYYDLLAQYHLKREDYAQALSATKKATILLDSTRNELQSIALIDAIEQLRLGIAKMAQQDISLANSKAEQENYLLALANSKLALDSAKAGAMLAKLNADNYKLSLNNENLKATLLKDSLEINMAVERESQIKANNSKKLFATVTSVMILLILIAAIYVIHSNRLSSRLKKVNTLLNINVEELTIATKKAQKANKQKTEFLNSMSHEIRTPLNAIVGFSQVMTEMEDIISEKEKVSMCNTIYKNSELLKTMITDILDITAIESGDYRMDLQKFTVNNLCRRAIELVEMLRPKSLEIRFESDVDDAFEIVTDHNRTIQVLVNLLTNAYKNTKEGSVTVSVAARQIPGCVQLAVADTGIGIPADKQEEVFERFKKLDMFKQGVGLGLSMCRVIAQRLNGKVFIDSGYTGGARFVFELPCPNNVPMEGK